MSGDTDRAKFLQKSFGYGLTGDMHHQCMTILYDATTRNGKDSICESVFRCLVNTVALPCGNHHYEKLHQRLAAE